MQSQLSFFLDPNSCNQITDPKTYLFHITSSCLIKELSYYATTEHKRDAILKSLEIVSQTHPEFILQLALYIRQEMYLRSIANFIVAFCVINQNTKPFLSKYYNYIVLIPGDLKETCQFFLLLKRLYNKQSFKAYDIRQSKINFPTILKTQIGKKFNQFSEYQLGKYASEASRKKMLQKYAIFLKEDKFLKYIEKKEQKKKLLKKQGDNNPDIALQIDKKIAKKISKFQRNVKHKVKNHHQWLPLDEKNIFDVDFLHFKDLIKICHISAKNRLLCGQILGKKYPSNEADFNKKYKDNDDVHFDPTLSGKRMRLKQPITWDRLLSEDKDKKKVWTQLIEKNDLPFMAMIKNLRNILQSEVKDECHMQVIDRIKNPYLVGKSKMFPLQFLSALEQIDQFEKDQEKLKQKMEEDDAKARKKIVDLPNKVVNLYKEALAQAIKCSVDRNLDELPGTTYIFCDVSGSMSASISGGKRYGSIRTCMDCGFILGLMARMKSKDCHFYLFSAPNSEFKKPYALVNFDKDEPLLDQFIKCNELGKRMDKSHEMIGQCIKDLLLDPMVKADNIIILSDMMITQGFSQGNYSMSDIIQSYIKEVNKEVMFYFMDISSYGKEISFAEEYKSSNCRVINGMSDNVLKFITTQKSQVEAVEEFCKQFLYKAQIKDIGQQIKEL